MKAQFILLACTLSISLSCSLNFKKAKEAQALNDAIRDVVLTNPMGPFNGSILVAKDGNILVRQHYGFIDIEKTAPINDQSRFGSNQLVRLTV